MGQGAGASGGGGGAAVSINAGGAVEMGSAAAVDVMTAAATSLDFLAFGFLVFFGRVLISVFPFDTGPVAFVAGLKAFLGPNVGAMKLSARRTASL